MAKKGRLGTASSIHSLPKCWHDWTAWRRAGIFDPTWRRECHRCGRIQLRKSGERPKDR